MPGLTSSGCSDLERERIRNAVSLLLDGHLPSDDRETLAAWQFADTQDRGAPSLRSLLSATSFSLTPSRCDRLHRVLQPHRLRPAVRSDESDPDARIVFLPCPGLLSGIDQREVYGFVEAGGVLVVSDRGIKLDVVGANLPHRGRNKPRRVRIDVGSDLGFEAYVPAVELPSGHCELDCPSASGAFRILARDHADGEPLVVLFRVGSGQVLYSVPHWFQVDLGWFGELERRPLAGVSWIRDLPSELSAVRLGDFAVSMAMNHVLRSGLGRALAPAIVDAELSARRVGSERRD